MGPAPLLAWIESTAVATTIGGSSRLTGLLSAVHLVGMTLLVGGALVSSLRLLGALFNDRPVAEITGAAVRGMGLGLAISIVTGVLLFSERASAAAANGFFQTKMLLLLGAAVFHVAVYRRLTARAAAGTRALRVAGALALALWVGVAAAGSAFILLE